VTENYPAWQFRKMSKGEMNVDPIEGEFFSTEALGSLPDALIREAIQNSLDAAIPGEQVKVSISSSSSDQHLLTVKSETYLRGLKSHLEAKQAGLSERVKLTDPMNYLVIEDFGTRGLDGDTREDEDKGTDEKKNDFFYFWRNIGRAVEGTTARGRWGLGKTVFQAASRINSFFGLTIRQNDPRKLVMGQSVLKIHWCDGSRHAPYGYFGLFEGDFVIPTEGKEFIEQFARDFRLQRKEETGLSVIIPFPDGEISPSAIIQAVVKQYFFPILSGDLAVKVVDGQKEHLLDAGTILQRIFESDWSDKDSVLRRLELAKWSIGLSAENYRQLKELQTDQAPKWDQCLFDAEYLDDLRREFDEGGRIALVVPLWVKKKGEDIEHSSFKVLIERDDRVERGEDYFIRDGVTITGVSSLRQKGIRVIVSVSDRPLSKLLGDSENPAHTEWQERSPKFKDRYDWGVTCLRYVKNSPKEIVKILSRPAEGRDVKLLRDLFSIGLPNAAEPNGALERPTEGEGRNGPAIPEPGAINADRFLQLQRTTQGFRLIAHPEAKRIPKEIDIEVAYDVRQGNPFRRYSPLDFELDKPPIRVGGKSLKASISKANVLHVVLEERNFQLSVTGFDPKRDLKIRTTTSLDAIL
jgi:hypothetical protein